MAMTLRKLFRRAAFLFGAAFVVHPDESVWVRINDHWMPL